MAATLQRTTQGFLLIVLLGIATISPLAASDSKEPLPLYQQEPFDLVVLNDPDRSQFKVLPIDFPGRMPPENPPPDEKLKIRMLDNPAELFEVSWRRIERIVLFEDALLREAGQLVDTHRFDEAFEYFEFLRRYNPKWPGTAAAWHRALAAEARWELDQGRSDRALLLLYELRQADRLYPQLSTLFAEALQARLQNLYRNDHLAAVRPLIAQARQHFPEHPELNNAENEARRRAEEEVQQSVKSLSDDEIDAAYRSVYRARMLDPDSQAARQQLARLRSSHPRIAVGVMLPAKQWSDRIDDLVSQRIAPLVEAPGVRLAEATPEGGRYEIPGGELRFEPIDRQLTLKPPTSPGLPNAWHLARRLIDRARPNSANCYPAWSRLCQTVTVPSGEEITIRLRSAPLSTPGILAQAIKPQRDAEPVPLEQLHGPYTVESDPSETMVFRSRDSGHAADASNPTRTIVVERYFATGREALTALEYEEIDVLQRVPWWAVDEVAANPRVSVVRYAIPHLHLLLVNPDRPIGKSRTFRRALVYGIDRNRILSHNLLRDTRQPGCVIISGPCSPGISLDDPLRYAYDDTIRPRPFDVRLAMTLLSFALNEPKNDSEIKTTEPVSPKLVLAHAPTEAARTACEAIARSVAPMGIELQLKSWPLDDAPPGFSPDIDLIYAEVALADPVNDLPRLLGPQGIAGRCSPYMQDALHDLNMAQTWPEARTQLHRIHRLAHDELPVIPLWQTVEHLAVRKDLTGIGNQPLTLYQNIDRWRWTDTSVAETANR